MRLITTEEMSQVTGAAGGRRAARRPNRAIASIGTRNLTGRVNSRGPRAGAAAGNGADGADGVNGVNGGNGEDGQDGVNGGNGGNGV